VAVLKLRMTGSGAAAEPLLALVWSPLTTFRFLSADISTTEPPSSVLTLIIRFESGVDGNEGASDLLDTLETAPSAFLRLKSPMGCVSAIDSTEFPELLTVLQLTALIFLVLLLCAWLDMDIRDDGIDDWLIEHFCAVNDDVFRPSLFAMPLAAEATLVSSNKGYHKSSPIMMPSQPLHASGWLWVV
jgi:hypothetical protein